MARKVVVAGGPKTGKTTYALQTGLPVTRLDDSMHLGWSEHSAASAEQLHGLLADDRPFVMEGAAADRTLRKWLDAHPKDRLDGVEVIRLTDPKTFRTAYQETMAKGCDTIWKGIKDELVKRGATLSDG